MTQAKVYHEGELEVQARVGVSQEAEMLAGVMLQTISVEIAHFIGQQTMAVFGSLDADGRVWASVLMGAAGFLQALDEHSLSFQRSACHGAPGDPLWRNLEHNPQIGMLLIELTSRRRLRLNGRLYFCLDGGFRIEAQRVYANCPKYIQRRRMTMTEMPEKGAATDWREGEELSVAQQALIGHADTFFVASAHPEQGADASHRGGHPGFVQVMSPRRLRIPDFVGNNMFNTLGNFISYPSAGLVFIDFEHGRILQLSGRPELMLEQSDERGETGGTCRYWEFEVEIWRESQLPLRLEWKFIDYSPYIPTTSGNNNKADTALFPLRLERAWMETGHIRGLQLVSAEGRQLPPFDPGAHLPVQVRDREGSWVERHYSLLSDPTDSSHYRIGVRLESQGRGGSRYLHETLRAGDLLQALPPRNAFPLVTDAEHTILLAGGIGITPLIAMMHALNTEKRSFELHYTARRQADLAFRREIESLAGDRACFYASAEPGQMRLDLPRILAKPTRDTHIYVCGPRGMILAARDLARVQGWSQEQLHFESFGAASQPQDRELSVELARSGLTIEVPATRSILDVLLDRGLTIPYECKRGECSLCQTRVLEGEPEHRDLCLSAQEQAGSMCICVSRASSARLKLDL
ncbi:MAG: pyridoxamine 5'-phosphate oxidase family protein [Candidatus Thiodiazotropha sp.]